MSIPHASTHDIRSLQLHKDVPISLQHITVDGGNNTEKLIPLILADVDAVMQMYIDAGKGDRDPYWTIPWPSSIAMAQELLAYRPDLVKNKRVADLGCGLGVGGLAAALSEADDVVFLDREPLALQCALINSYMNGFSIEKERNEEVYDSVHTLIQCQSDSLPEDVSKVLQLLSREKRKSTKISSFVFDWSQPNNLKPFDVVLACDVLYESFSVEPVAELVPRLLKFNTGRLILADPPLRTKYNRDRFVELLQKEEFVVEEYVEGRVVKVWDEEKKQMKDTEITFMVFKRSAFGDTVGVKHFM